MWQIKNNNMQNDTNFSPQESLLLIEGMIKKAQNRFAENGHLYLLWGWVVFGCSMLQFVLLYFFQYERHFQIWMLTWAVVFYQVAYLKKRKNTRAVKTYYDEIIGFVWISFVVLMFLVGLFLAISNINRVGNFIPVTHCLLALYGMPVFLSGIILRFKPLIFGGIGCWLLSVIASLTTNSINQAFQLLFIPAAMLMAWIIPGYLLRKKYLQTN